jgi:hypothetical protein
MKKLFAFGLIVALAGAVSAMPTVFGPSGGLLVPSTSIQQGVALTVSSSQDMSQKYPLTQLNWGVLPNLELGAGYFDKGGDATWGINAKYALPWTIAKGKLAAALVYNVENGHEDDVELHGLLIGSWPVFKSSEFTAAIDFQGGDDEDATGYLFGLTKTFKNGTLLGLEYNFNLRGQPFDDFAGYFGDDFGAAYLSFPINEMLSGRVALAGIGDSDSGTNFIFSVGAKL